jgi:ribosome-binding protein aMBF1 (putative translation factor)
MAEAHTFWMAKDFLNEIVRERTAKNPKFPGLVKDAERRREMAKRLVAQREALGLSQTVVAARMGTSASVVSKLESGQDVRLSTLQRYCAALGRGFDIRINR